MEPAKRFSLSPLLSSLLTELSEKWPRISRNTLDRLITDRWKDGGDKREGKGKGKKRRNDSIHGNYVKLRGKETYRSFWGGKIDTVCTCTCVHIYVSKNANPITILLLVFRDCYRRALPIDPLIFHSSGVREREEGEIGGKKHRSYPNDRQRIAGRHHGCKPATTSTVSVSSISR